MSIGFSGRTRWHREPNRLASALESRRASGKPILDLTTSNPTQCGIPYPEQELLSALSRPAALRYEPHPRGILAARLAVTQYYADKGLSIDPETVVLTASTSEAYSLIFKILCSAGEQVIVPRPSYPLFDYLAQVNDVELAYYDLVYDGGWNIDLGSVERAISRHTKAMILVNPNNPTGAFLKTGEYRRLVEIALNRNLALIADEVFVDYAFENSPERFGSTAGARGVLTFTLNGLSKTAGLPHLKCGWIVVSGESPTAGEAIDRLEILSDTFLSVNTPVQIALPELLRASQGTRQEILSRVKGNYEALRHLVSSGGSALTPLQTEGGWCAVVRIPRTKSEEDWALELLDQKGVSLYPGYFFDFEQEGYLVLSLLPEPEIFRRAVGGLVDLLSTT